MHPPPEATPSTPATSRPREAPPAYGTPVAGVNAKAILALPLAVAFSIVGVVLAHVARSEIRRTGERGDGLAKAALIIGYPVMALWLSCWVPLFLSVLLAE